jgi:GNAT superfamily N-acetyltransferase
VLYPNGPDSKIHIPNDEDGTHLGAWIQLGGDTTSSAESTQSESSRRELVTVISLFQESLPSHLIHLLYSYDSMKSLRFRKFACLETHQGRGFGTRVLEHIFELARGSPKLGPGSVVWCDARLSTQGWYLRRGMKMIGDVFFKGDIEYIVMVIQI